MEKMYREAARQGHLSPTAFDPIGESIMWLVVSEAQKEGGLQARLSSYTMAKILRSTRNRIRCRLKKLCRFGLVRIETAWRNDGTRKKKTQLISINPVVGQLMEPGTKPSVFTTVSKHLVGIGLARLEYEEDVQGFETDCLYGEPEPPREDGMEYINDDARLDALVAAESADKAQKVRDQMLWRDRDKDFVSGCARIWVFGQSEMGRGTARPNWAGDIKNMPSQAMRERRELTKTFRQYGCRTASLAWYIFACGVPAMDEKTGKPQFDLTVPHRQFATIDRKPSQFTKHFNAILKDAYFIQIAKKGWQTIGSKLHEIYGDIIDVGPEDGEAEKDKIGFTIGSNDVELGDVNAVQA